MKRSIAALLALSLAASPTLAGPVIRQSPAVRGSPGVAVVPPTLGEGALVALETPLSVGRVELVAAVPGVESALLRGGEEDAKLAVLLSREPAVAALVAEDLSPSPLAEEVRPSSSEGPTTDSAEQAPLRPEPSFQRLELARQAVADLSLAELRSMPAEELSVRGRDLIARLLGEKKSTSEGDPVAGVVPAGSAGTTRLWLPAGTAASDQVVLAELVESPVEAARPPPRSRLARLPWLTAAMIAANAGVFALQVQLDATGAYPADELIWDWGWKTGAFPLIMDLGDAADKLHMAASAVTSMFLHGGPVHLLGNMAGLAVYGTMLESRVGRLRWLALYFLAGLGGVVATELFFRPSFDFFGMPNIVPSIGASAAIMGLLGAVLAVYAGTSLRIWRWARAASSWLRAGLRALLLLPWWAFVGLNLVQVLLTVGAVIVMALLDLESSVGHDAHLGGLLAGFYLALVWRARTALKR